MPFLASSCAVLAVNGNANATAAHAAAAATIATPSVVTTFIRAPFLRSTRAAVYVSSLRLPSHGNRGTTGHKARDGHSGHADVVDRGVHAGHGIPRLCAGRIRDSHGKHGSHADGRACAHRQPVHRLRLRRGLHVIADAARTR